MSYFLKSVGDTGFIQMLRSQMKPEDLEEFDKMVKEKLQEYDELWMKIEPTITHMNKGGSNVEEKNNSESSDQSGFDQKPDNEQS